MSGHAFAIVWSPDSPSPPKFRHDDLATATYEAERLAAKHPGQQFYVLAAVSVSQHKTVVTEQFHEFPIPF